MDIPTYDLFMLPLLRGLADGTAKSIGELAATLADQAGLDAEARAEMLPSGRQAVYRNRVGWAATHLKKAGLIASPARGQVIVTAQGRAALADIERAGIRALDRTWLERYPTFREWMESNRANIRQRRAEVGSNGGSPIDTDRDTPAERMESAYADLQAMLADEVLERVRQVLPAYFEQIVVDLMIAMGYGGSREDAGRVIGRSGDGGIDGIIDQDRLGLDRIYLQAKRWQDSVGRPIVQAFSGSLEGERATKGVLITTSTFTADARDYVQRISKKIVLIDGQRLAQLMIQHNVGVSAETTFVVKRVDSDYFEPD